MNDRTMTQEEIEKAELFEFNNHIQDYVYGLASGNTEKEIMFEQALKDWGGSYFDRSLPHKCRGCGACMSLDREDI